MTTERTSLALIVLTLALLQTTREDAPIPVQARHEATTAPALSRLFETFVENQGQWPHPSRFVTRCGPTDVHLDPSGLTFFWRGRHDTPVCELKIEGLSEELRIVGRERTRESHSFFRGNDPNHWRSDVGSYRQVVYEDPVSGIGVRVRRCQAGNLEYDLELGPNTSLSSVVLQWKAAGRMQLGSDGALEIETSVGRLRQRIPAAWRVGQDGAHELVRCEFRLIDDQRFGFAVHDLASGEHLVIDPVLEWSTFLGGAGADAVVNIVPHSDGSVVLLGATGSTNLPVAQGAFAPTFSGPLSAGPFGDMFVARLSQDGQSLDQCTYLGGSGMEVPQMIRLTSSGDAVISGSTASPDFPTTPAAFDRTYGGGRRDGFLAKLSADGRQLMFGTFLGGRGQDDLGELTLDGSGALIVPGATDSPDFPVTPNAFSMSGSGQLDGTLAVLSPDASTLLYSTLIGGSGIDGVAWSSMTNNGDLVFAGSTYSADFPVTAGAFDRSHNGESDVFVGLLDPRTSALIYSTFVGGELTERLTGIALDTRDAVTIGGETHSLRFPVTTGAFDSSPNGNLDSFVARVAPDGSRLEFSTYLGGGGHDHVTAIALDGRGTVTIVGGTSSPNFPVTAGCYDPTYNSPVPPYLPDAFVARMAPAGTELYYATFFGARNNDFAYCVSHTPEGSVVVSGESASPAFPITPGVLMPVPAGGFDGFIAELDLLPTGVRRVGDGSAYCGGTPTAGVTAMPYVGNRNFRLTCDDAPTLGVGEILFAGASLATPFSVAAAAIWLDLNGPWWFGVPVRADSVGGIEFAVPIPSRPSLAGFAFHAQFLWYVPGSGSCPTNGLSASSALEIVVQP